ncbi:MAG: 6,7-dimethyl-8-ribityllumazine synthase [Bacteroidales bacterium]|nr:6,7-dimethyl-8-ribityllumazine synthase [Bacteroidales bacterium]
MATQYHNLSEYDAKTMPDAKGMRVGIVVSEWNESITSRLLEGAVNTLVKLGVSQDDILVRWVPGSFELVYGATLMMELPAEDAPDAVIVLGCVIRGETPHFEYVCSGVTQGVTALNTRGKQPVIFGLLTNNTMQQSVDRAGGIHGNKGDEAAVTAVRMIAFKRSLY